MWAFSALLFSFVSSVRIAEREPWKQKANTSSICCYFEAIKALVAGRDQAKVSERAAWQQAIDEMYALVADEIRNRAGQPLKPVSFGTSGWRGLLGKELFVRSVAVVTAAILSLYKTPLSDRGRSPRWSAG